MNVEDYLKKLESTGWLQHLTETKRGSLAQELEEWRERNPEWMYLALATGGYDAEMIEDDESYPFLIESYREASGGMFDPEDVASLVEYDESAKISFTFRGERYEVELPFESDYVDDGFEPFLNEVLESTGLEERFFTLPAIDQIGYLVFVPPHVYAAAEEQGLVPKPDWDEDEDWDEDDWDEDDDDA